MSLCVLSVAYSLAPVGPDAVGGAEQVLSRLDHALIAAGHRSIVIACAGSHTVGTLVATPVVQGVLTAESRTAAQAAHRAAIERVLREQRVDVVHMHGIDFHACLPDANVPTLVTLHLPPDWYPPEVFRLSQPNVHLHCVSESQHRRCPVDAPLWPVIPNGVDLPALRNGSRRRGHFALTMGRICPEKNFHVALDAGRSAGLCVLLAGQVFSYPEHQAYFETQIQPRLDHWRRFVGPVGPLRKMQLLAAARCLLLPTLAPETSSLVAMEALACGTPVIAFPSGALPEIIEHGVTGFLVTNEKEMASAIAHLDELDTDACLHAARTRFSADRMIRQYFEAYTRLAASAQPSTVTLSADAIRVVASSERREPPAAAAESDLLVEPITTTARLQQIEPAWANLWRRAVSSVFQSPQWLISWWRNFSEGELSTLALWCRGRSDPPPHRRLVALVPMYIYQQPGSSVRQLLPLGISTSDYHDILVDPDFIQPCLAAIARHFTSGLSGWHIMEFPQLRCDASMLSLQMPDQWRCESDSAESCPQAVLPAAWETFERELHPRFAANLRYCWRRLQRLANAKIQWAREVRQLDAMLPALLQLHAARWSARGESGVLADPRVARWHAQALPALLQTNLLEFALLSIDNQPAAVFYGLWDDAKHQRLDYYLSGFDPACRQLSPGSLLIRSGIQRAISCGATCFDFLRGCEAYKYQWGARDVQTIRRRIWHGTPHPDPQPPQHGAN